MSIEPDSLVKQTWRPKFTSEFSMGQFDFARIDKTLTRVDELAGMVTSTAYPSLELMQSYFAHLKNLYDNFKAIIASKTIQEEMDRIVEEGKRRKRVWENAAKSGMPISPVLIHEFVDLLDNFKARLYEIKQFIGLGIIVKRNMTTEEKIKQGVRGNRDLGNLPEA